MHAVEDEEIDWLADVYACMHVCIQSVTLSVEDQAEQDIIYIYIIMYYNNNNNLHVGNCHVDTCFFSRSVPTKFFIVPAFMYCCCIAMRVCSCLNCMILDASAESLAACVITSWIYRADRY